MHENTCEANCRGHPAQPAPSVLSGNRFFIPSNTVSAFIGAKSSISVNPPRARAAQRIRQIVTQWPTQTMGVDEAYLIRSAVLGTAKIPARDSAEVGIFRGGTTKVICEAKRNGPTTIRYV